MSEEISIENLFKDSTAEKNLAVDNEISINELFGVEEITPVKNQDIDFTDNQIKDKDVLEKPEIEKQPKVDIEPLKEKKAKQFDKGMFKMAEREAFDKYKETGEIDLNLIPEEKEEIGFFEDLSASLGKGILETGAKFDELREATLKTGIDLALQTFDSGYAKLEEKEKRELLNKVAPFAGGLPYMAGAGEISDALQAPIDKLSEHIIKYDSESITDDIANKKYGQAARRALSGAVESLPSVALAYSGIGGLFVLAGSSAGGKFKEEFEDNTKDSVGRIFTNSLLTGATEATFELVTRGILSRATNLIKSGSKEAAEELINSFSTQLLKKFATEPGKEGLSEFATELSIDLLNWATLDRYDYEGFKDFWNSNYKKWIDSGIIGTVTGSGIVSTGALTSNKESIRNAAELTLTPESDRKIITDAAININRFNEQIKNANKEEVQALEVEIIKEEEKIINTRKKVSEELNMMNPDELRNYAEGIDNITKEKRKLNSFLSPVLKTKTQEQIDELQYKNDQILRESVDRRLDENIKTVGVEDLGRTVNDYSTKEDYQKAYDNTEAGKKNSINVTSSDGFIDTEGDIYINKEVAQKVRNVNVAAHELLHGILNNNIKEPGQLKRLVTEFKAILPRETADLIQKRIDDNYRFETDEQGNKVEKPESEYMEEYFTAFADLIGNRKVKFNENIFTKIGEKITPIFKGKGYGRIKFETGKDVYNFIKSYQKQIAKGELKPETIKAAKKVTDQDAKTEFSKTTEKTINNFTKKDGKPMSQVEWFEFTGETNNEGELVNQIEIANAFEGAINAKIKGTNKEVQNYFGRDRDKVVEDFKDILDKRGFFDSKIEQFNPEVNDNFSGYMAGIINNAYKTLLDQNTKRIKTVPTSKKIGGEESRATIGETLVSDEISPEDYADIKLAQDKLKKIKPQQSKIAKKIDLTDNEINLAKRDIINFLRKTDRPAMTDTKKFFKALVDYTTGKSIQPGGFAKVIYDKLSLPKDGKLSTKNKEAFVREIAEDLIALNKVDPAVMRRSKWTPFYELEIKRMNTKQTQKAIDEGRIPSTTNLEAGNDLFKVLNPTVDEVVGYLNNIRPDVLKRKMPKFLGEVIVKNEFNEIVDNLKQPVYDAKGNETDNTVDLSESITEEEVTRGAPQVREKIARPEGVKFSNSSEFKKITEDLTDDKVEEVSRLLEDVDSNVGLSNDSQILKDQVKEVVDTAYPEKLTGKAKIVNELVKYLKPFTRQIAKFKDIKINIENYIKSLVSDNVINNYGKAFGVKNLTEVFRTKNKEQRAFSKLNAKEVLKLKDEDGNLIYKNPLDLAAEYMQYKAMLEDGSANPSRAMTFYTEAAGIYKTKAEAQAAIDSSSDGLGKIRKIEDSEGNITGYQVGGDHTKSFIKNFISPVFSEESNPITDVRVIGGTKTNPKEQVEFTYKNGDKKLVDSPRRAKQEVTQDMIDNKVSKEELDKREFDANRAFNFVVNQYKAAKILLDKKLATNENIAMLAAGMGANMKGPIRAAAMLRYLPVNSKYKKLRKPTGGKAFEYEHGIPAVIVNLAIADVVLNPKSEVDLKKLQESYTVGVIDVDFNDNFGRFFKARMPFSYKIGDLPITRWYNEFTTGGDVHALYDLKENKIVGEEEAKLWQEIQKAKTSNVKTLSNNVISFSKTNNNRDIIEKAKTVDKALKIARDPNATVKKIRVFDFDDTLATTKSDVLFTAPDGTEGRLNAEEFAKQGAQLLEEGYVFDFSEFNKVTKGKPGPLLDIAKKIQAARGTEDVFVLTARAPEAQVAIKEFLDGVGLNIPLKNITGLGNSTGEAKANWMVEKAAEGYNDFYFADDAYQNVKAVKDAMSVLDVKSKVQQAKINFSKSVNEDFNKIIEQTTGIASEKVYSEAKAKVRGANKGNKKFFIPYSAEDFMGLIYPLLSKGKLGDSQMAWFKQNLLDPYARAQENLSTDRLQLMEDFKALKKALEVPKDLRKKTDSGFTKEQAVRVYLFNKAGFDVPGISKTDLNELLDLVNSDGVLKAFGDQIFNITKGDGYAKPGENWLVGTITTDLIDVLNTVKRAKYLEQSGYTANAELIFSKENLNKLEAVYGAKYREAMENILGRMKSGKNRIFSGNRLSNRVLDYINNSTGAIMFFNTRSAVLQTISSINFLNWSFNNPIKAGAAFANQPQYWKDFVELINSDYLVDRRNGLKLNINESEIADAASTSKNKAKAAINYILQKGFLPTQYADSFAIASGGATFYRNRINDLIKNQGMSEADAKKQAMLEWRETAEISQQSSDPSKISAQQASDLGRVILAFANTPMQYARIQKRAVQDLVKGRGDAKTNVSKIIYYAVVQNLIFNALQSALFSLGFGDDEDDMTEKQLEAYEKDKKKKYLRIANGMLDSQLRGLGLAGATVAVIKNFLTDIYERSGRKRPEYVDSIYKLLQISPPVSSKISKIRGAAWQFDSKKRREEIFEKGFSIDNPAYEAGAKVISATANIPLDRVYSKVNNISGAMDEDAETWQTIAMLAGWPEWQIMPKEKSSQELPKFSGVKIKKFKKYDYKEKTKKGEKRKFGY